tara:strand:+ start:2954 stop:3286 length:333 start_codon:yes stop_codon:yes gene_type:complete
MNFTLWDNNVDTTMNIFMIIANLLNLIYNIPQIVLTYKTKSTRDISGWFIALRAVGNSIWIAYGFAVDSLLIILNNAITVFSSLFIGYYKICELYKNNKNGEFVPHAIIL